MKIAFLHLTMGLVNRGSEVVIDSLASSFAKSHDVLVLQSGPVAKKSYQVKQLNPLISPPKSAPRHILDKILFRLHLDQESGAVITFTKAALKPLNEFNPDIIIAVNGPLQLKLLRFSSLTAKLVAFGHAGIGYHDRDTLAATPDLFIALTKPAEIWARKNSKSSTKIAYIPNPLDLSHFKKSKKAKLNLDHPIVLTVGSLSAYKNILTVADAIRSTPSSWLLIGDGDQSVDLTRSLSTLTNSFLWVKHVEASLIPSYYLASDVFCFTPDPQEAFGMVYLEAMAAGLPIVASDDAIRREIIGEQGIYVDPHDVESIASGISQALKLGKVDYSQQLKPYQLKHVVSQLEQEFYDLIK
jgi:glycosyltransferase involved in cell wall biosynthesis